MPAINYVDLNIDWKFNLDDGPLEGYPSIQNIFDQRPRVNPTNALARAIFAMARYWRKLKSHAPYPLDGYWRLA